MSHQHEKVKAAKRKTATAIEVVASQTAHIAELSSRLSAAIKENHQLRHQLEEQRKTYDADMTHAHGMVKKVAIAHVHTLRGLFERCYNHFYLSTRIQKRVFNSQYAEYQRLVELTEIVAHEEDIHDLASDKLVSEASKTLRESTSLMATLFLQNVINEDALKEEAKVTRSMIDLRKSESTVGQEAVPVGRIVHGDGPRI